MLNKIAGIGMVALIAVLVIGVVTFVVLPDTAAARGGPPSGAGGPAAANPERLALDVIGTEVQDLSPSEEEALRLALDDEYKAWSVYDQVIADFGAVRPFTSIQRAEEKHIDALLTLFERYELDAPANDWPGNVPTFETLPEACAAGVQAEIDNAALYDGLFAMVDNPDIVQVFTALQQASETKHLPAFERCAP